MSSYGSVNEFQAKLNALGLSGSDALLLADALPEDVRREWDLRERARIADRRYVDGRVGLVSYKKCPIRRPAPARPIPASGSDQRDHTETIKSIQAEVYIPALTDSEIFPGGRCNCPWPDHADANPSASFKDAIFFCHRCGEGGGIFQLASAISGLPDRGAGFIELRRWIAQRMLGVPA